MVSNGKDAHHVAVDAIVDRIGIASKGHRTGVQRAGRTEPRQGEESSDYVPDLGIELKRVTRSRLNKVPTRRLKELPLG